MTIERSVPENFLSKLKYSFSFLALHKLCEIVGTKENGCVEKILTKSVLEDTTCIVMNAVEQQLALVYFCTRSFIICE